MLAFAFLAFASPAIAQVIERQISGNSDASINAGIFVTVRSNCTAGPLPVVRLVVPPGHGKVTMKQGRVRATNLKQCLAVDLPAFVAVYRSAHDFTGTDSFTLEVISAGGKTQTQHVTVKVTSNKPDRGI